MGDFWLIIMGIVIGTFLICLWWFLPIKALKIIARNRNLKEPQGWIYATIIFGWWSPILYWIFAGAGIEGEGESIKEKPKEEELSKIEQEIFESLKERIKDVPMKEVKKIIEEEVRKRNYLSEDWQAHYAIERIEKELKNFQRAK